MSIDHLQLSWFFLFIFQISIALYFLKLYWRDKDKGKLVFSLGFLVVCYSHFYEIITPSEFGQTPLNLFTAIQYWSFFPLIFALAIAVHQKNVQAINKDNIFTIFFVLSAISFVLAIINPVVTSTYFGLFTLAVAVEIALVALYKSIKFQGKSDLLFLFSLICYLISGIGLLGYYNIGISIFGFFSANAYLFLVFRFASSSKDLDQSKISNYFSIKQQLVETKTELSEKEKTFQTLFNQLADPVMILDKKGTFLELTDRVKEYTGFEKNEILGKNFLSTGLLTKKSKAVCIKNLMKRMAGVEVKPYMVEALTKDGRKIPFEVNAQQIIYQGKKADLVIFRDISERIRAEQRIRESEERYRNIFDQASDGIFIHDLKGHIIDVNQQMADIFGYSKKEFTNLKVKDVFLDGTWNDDQQFSSQLLEDGMIKFESEFVKKNDDVFTGDVISSIIFIGGKKYVQGTLRDITKRKEAERKLNEAHQKLKEMNNTLERKVEKRTERIQRLLKQKDAFINQLGHDLKNPLGPITNLSKLLEEKENDPEKKEMFAVILRNAGYMKNLVTKTLELARLNSSNTKISFEQIRLKDFVDSILKHHSYLFDQKDIVVENQIDDNVRVYADQLLLKELLINLVNNAVKYSDDYGKISLNGETKDNVVEISVVDTGIGMTEDQLGNLFDEFYKADESRHDFDSSGLGLSIAKRIVEKHGGRIWAESKGLGKGSTFYFTLPHEFKGYDDGEKNRSDLNSYGDIRQRIDAVLTNQ